MATITPNMNINTKIRDIRIDVVRRLLPKSGLESDFGTEAKPIEQGVLRVITEDGYWSEIWLKSPWCFVFWLGRPTEDLMFSTAYAAGAAWNDAHWQHERFNQLLVAARAELDQAKRREMYVEMQSIVRDDGGTVVPLFAANLMAATTKLAHGPVASNAQVDGMRLAERWWFA